MLDPDSTFWLVLDRVSVILSFLVIFSIVGYVIDAYYNRKRSRKLAALTGKTERPQALALSHTGGSIKFDVALYLKQTYPNLNIPLEEHKVVVDLTPQKVQKILDEIRKLKEEYQNLGVTELHLFLATPTAMAAGIGALFDNWKGVKVYQLDRNTKVYQPWLTLDQAKSTSLRDVLKDRVLQAVEPASPPTPRQESLPPSSTPEDS